MLTPAFLFVVLSALGWSALDFVRKRLAGRVGPFAILIVLTVGQGAVMAALFPVQGLPHVAPGYWALAGGSIALNLAANLLFMRAVTLSPLSLTIPYLSLTPVFTSLLALPLLHEAPSPGQWLGVVAVVAGALGLQAQAGGAATPGALLRAYRREPGSWLMTLVAAFWSLAAPLDKRATALSDPAFHAMVLAMGVTVALVALMTARGRWSELRGVPRQLPWLLVGVASGSAAVWLQLSAMQGMFVGLVEAIKRTIDMAMAVLVGKLAFDEPLTRGKAGAIALMALGLALVLH